MNLVNKIIAKRLQERGLLKKHEDFRQGDTVKVYTKVKEGEKERTQIYRGVVIKIQGKDFNRSFTVRKMSSGIGVERTFPFASTKVEKIEVVSRGKTRRSRIYFLRNLTGRAARLNSELVVNSSASESNNAAAEAAPEAAKTEADKAE